MAMEDTTAENMSLLLPYPLAACRMKTTKLFTVAMSTPFSPSLIALNKQTCFNGVNVVPPYPRKQEMRSRLVHCGHLRLDMDFEACREPPFWLRYRSTILGNYFSSIICILKRQM